MTWERNIRSSGLLEWVCECGIGHPDMESALEVSRRLSEPNDEASVIENAYAWSSHGCCGCCSRDDFPGAKDLAEIDGDDVYYMDGIEPHD